MIYLFIVPGISIFFKIIKFFNLIYFFSSVQFNMAATVSEKVCQELVKALNTVNKSLVRINLKIINFCIFKLLNLNLND